jgi:TfoX/Sxy family transcriptional regulator of competence genes
MDQHKMRQRREDRYQQLRKMLGGVGLIVQGTITPRYIQQTDPQDRRKKKSYGPYYQWTWKKEGKTVTVNLSDQQLKAFRQAIRNQRQVEVILGEMRTLSLEILNLTTPGVQKRARSSNSLNP